MYWLWFMCYTRILLEEGELPLCIVFQVVFNVDPAKPVQIALAIGPYGYNSLARMDSSH